MNNVAGGTVTGDGEYDVGQTCTMTATPAEGYTFINWTDNRSVVSTLPTIQFVVDASRTLTANFQPTDSISIQTVALSAGWNWFSTNVDITMDDLKAALHEALPNANPITIKSQGNGQASWNGRLWTGQLRALDVAQMYKITVPNACEITLEGLPVNPAEHPVTIMNGMNWIGYPLGGNMTITNAFAGFPVSGDVVKSASNGQAAWNGRMWVGGLLNLVPGNGYIYKSNATESRTFTFPD